MRLLALALLLAAPAAAAQTAPADSVRAAFAEVRAAMHARDGAAAYDRVDAATRAHYDRLAEAARHAPEAEVRRLPFQDQLAVLAARLRVPADALVRMDGRDLFIHAVREGWVGRDVARAALGPVRVRGAVAEALGAQGGETLPLELTFRREPEGWRLGLAALTEAAAVPLAMVMRQANLTATDLALRLLATEGEGPVPPSVWTPPSPR